MPSHNTDLSTYFNWLLDLLVQKTIRDEKSLSATAEIPLLNLADSKTLLQALGYDNSQVHPQYPMDGIATVKKCFADFRVGSAPSFWVLELKSPSEKIDNPDFAKQLQDYMEGVNKTQGGVPLGILFNGFEARAYINPKFKPLRNYTDKIGVAVAKASDVSQLLLLFQELQCNSLPPDTLKLAKKLARTHSQILAKEKVDKDRKRRIREIVTVLLACPDKIVSDAIIQAVPDLAEMNVSPDDFQEVWASIVADKALAKPTRRLAQHTISRLKENEQ